MAKKKAPPAIADNEDDKAVRTFTGWKLDLCRAVRADHKVTPGPASLFAAFMDHVNRETKKAWPSEGALALALGVSVPTIRKYLGVLIDAKWLKADGKSNRGTTIYEVQDFRMNAVLDQFAIDLERLRDTQAKRKAKRRAAYQASNVSKQGFRPKDALSINTGLEPSHNTGLDEHHHRTPSFKVSTESEASSYGRATNGW